MRIERLNPLPTVGEGSEAQPNRVSGDSTSAHPALGQRNVFVVFPTLAEI